MKSINTMRTSVIAASCAAVLLSCSSSVHAPQTTRTARANFTRQLLDSTIEATLSLPLTQETASRWESACWGMGLARYTSQQTTGALRQAFRTFHQHPTGNQRALLEVTYALYPDEFVQESEGVMLSTTNEKLFAMASLHFLRATAWREIQRVKEQMHRTFPAHDVHPILRMLTYALEERATGVPQTRPPLEDLLSAPIVKGRPVMFSLQRKNRQYSGLALVRDANGRFVKQHGSIYFSVPQLALSSSDLPGYLTNGNTPQGIFSVQGFGRSTNLFIGPTENVQTVLPFEAKPFEFFHSSNSADTMWSRERYANLLPPSWRDYLPIYTAYYAGQAGRWDIIAHGTTIDPELSHGKPYFPNAPTLGCLSAAESWSPNNGERVWSDQQTLIDVMQSIGFEKGYLIVVELGDERRAVLLRDVLPILDRLAEQPSVQR
jgi:hypothetical protein